ncbi:hypothetical protein COMA1_10411 [Candidatus Nitrospira nitrosa]|uniref:Uncharacterized protein n=1 Tax=Candidatus Nitrospira nitrosa TaxID=1742972 RepID=A0A0S4L8D8_9BACT|nr:hypothetical protein COMA1_10411 [Candidatus Nitrospira nitrosa]
MIKSCKASGDLDWMPIKVTAPLTSSLLNVVFADTAYWLALANPFNRHHSRAVDLSSSL